jgi:phage terminase small subunit
MKDNKTTRKLTAKQQAFVDGKACGLNNRDAAIAAGYPPNSAAQTATKLMQHPSVRLALRNFKKVSTEKGHAKHSEDDGASVLKAKYASSLDFMIDAMNNPKLPPGVRFDAAKQLLPYQHARIGESGKKEKAKDRAHAVTGTTRGKFTPKAAPPALKVVGGKG